MKQHTFEHSTQIRIIRYFDTDQILEIEFKTGKTYQYLNVPESVYEGALAADSVGKYVNEHVKKAFEYKQIPF